MSKNKEPIYMDKNGYEKFLSEIASFREKINGISEYSNSNSTDRYDLEAAEIRRQKEILVIELNLLLEQLERVVIVEKGAPEDIVDIDDIVAIDMFVNGQEPTENIFKLTGGIGNLLAETPEISINSPLGRTIYKKHVGDTCSYTVNERTISVFIKEKLNLTENLDSPQR